VLCREAKKMGQPGKVRKANNNVRIFAMDTPQSKVSSATMAGELW
jgi:hypothetical protein